MDQIEHKRQTLLETLRGYGNVAVAFSAGVDSAVVCKAASLACSKAWAVTAVSPSVAEGEVEEAARLADTIGIPHVVIHTQEFDNPNYVSNPVDRCRFCKTELYSQIVARKAEIGFDVIANGANTDDLGDYRPGMQAADEFQIRSPLIEAACSKSDVRALAKLWNLSIWDKPASPCLSSRIAYGVEVTPERLKRIDKAEQFLRTELGIRELRVRCEANDLARLEVPTDSIANAIAIREQISQRLKSLGFQRVTIDLDGFRSGSMNESLNLVHLRL
ncbi:MAG: ATP-dependent sacrificial sulfur transferase LarE [Planctomycetaceae bacterium]